VADVAVVAHSRKSFGGGLPELREILAREGITDPLWYEVKKSRQAPEYARRAAAKGADVIFVWGGDGTVQRCIDAVAGTDTAVAILPAGTSNLLAVNLEVDGHRFFKGKVSCVLVANVSKTLGGVKAFPRARPDDGRLDLGVMTAGNPVQWTRTFGRLALGHPDKSPFVKVTRGKKFRIRFDRKVLYELDGGARKASKKLRIKVHPGSVTVCVPPRPRA
jgi:diacylglycerol kinase family enzyme